MPITINGNGSITGLTAGGISDTDAVGSAALPSSSVLKVFNQTLTAGQTITVADNRQAGNSTAWVDSTFNLTCNLSRSDSNLLILSDMKYTTRNNDGNGFNAPYRIYDVTSSQIVLGQVGTHVNQRPISTGPVGASGPNMGDAYGTHPVPCMVFYNPPSNSSTRQFKIQFTGANNSGTVYLGRNHDNGAYMWDSKGPCSLTILEIAAWVI